VSETRNASGTHYLQNPQALVGNVDGVLQQYTKSAFFANNIVCIAKTRAFPQI
jgi:hypothetical protein